MYCCCQPKTVNGTYLTEFIRSELVALVIVKTQPGSDQLAGFATEDPTQCSRMFFGNVAFSSLPLTNGSDGCLDINVVKPLSQPFSGKAHRLTTLDNPVASFYTIDVKKRHS